MTDIDFTNILRLDGCFRFLTLGFRIHLHQSRVSEIYFDNLPESVRNKIVAMSRALYQMSWDLPAFHSYREDENAQKYYVHATAKGEISESQYAELYQKEFELFKTMI